MARVAREVVEAAGINVQELVQKLNRAMAAELTTYYYYTILRANCIGIEGENLKEIAEDARLKDRNHFEALVPRILELGGQLYRDLRELHDDAACAAAYAPADPYNVRALLNILVEAERCAVRLYTDICNMTFGKDHRTYDLALAILHEEVEHEAWFAEFLGEGPSGHGGVRTEGHSPFVSKFLH
ncbi:MAG TPA: DNA protection during starvation protein [Dehalococcoidia bacterium]|nr:DNA protection during starvation protein [Dehalococcoidia bacterium]